MSKITNINTCDKSEFNLLFTCLGQILNNLSIEQLRVILP